MINLEGLLGLPKVQRGFTIIEVIFVIVIISILLVASISNTNN